jgi:ATP-dependent DNA helicase RecQ
MERTSRSKLLRIARERFQVESFRPGQLELIELVLAGKDALGILPTGAGKSLTFQLPALLMPGVVVVVSPLIALMQDQLDKLADQDIASAGLNSTLRASEERELLDEIRAGEPDIVYVTPERLENPAYLEPLKAQRVSLFVVDEAHCVSQWGHDFRPAYLNLRSALAELGRPPVLALTATATPDVVRDIVTQLGMRDPGIVSTGVERPNLFFEVERTPRREQKREALLEVLRTTQGVGICYVSTIRVAHELHGFLVAQGIRAGLYHGKLRAAEREETQRRFMNDELEVMVATNAFGLGIDKPDIRFVVHYNFPGSLEAYYQEAGRAGRDGGEARACLLYRLEDKNLQTFFLAGKRPRRQDTLHLVDTLRAAQASADAKSGVRVQELAALSDNPLKRVRVVVAELEGAGIVKKRGDRVRLSDPFADPGEVEALLVAHEERHRDDRKRLEAMMHYAQSVSCRMQTIRGYFGEEPGERCQHCDSCTRPLETSAAPRKPAARKVDRKALERLVASAVGGQADVVATSGLDEAELAG